MKEEVERLEKLLLNENPDYYKRCEQCKKVTQSYKIHKCCAKGCAFMHGCSLCKDSDEYDYCNWCFRDGLYCKKGKHSQYIFLCDMPQCDKRYCYNHHWVRNMDCGHHICQDHDARTLHVEGVAVCRLCVFERIRNSTAAITTLLGLLRRKSVCHKDVYSNVFIPLVKDVWKHSKKKECWNNPSLNKKIKK